MKDISVAPLDDNDILIRRAVSAASIAGITLSAISLLNPTRSSKDVSYYCLPLSLLSSGLLYLVAFGSGGPRWSFLYNLFGLRAPKVVARATVLKPGYEPVFKAFVGRLKTGREQGIQFVAYVNGECVVDLHGSLSTDPDLYKNFAADSYFPCWSSGKNITAAVVAWMVDKGYLDYDSKISNYWPGFKGGGKDELKLSRLMKHAAGLQDAPKNVVTYDDLLPENIAKGSMSEVIENMTCDFPNDPNQFTYHSVTRGWILNEVVRRVDPQKRTIGKILQDEIAKPLGIDKEIYSGLPKELSDPKRNDKFRFNSPLPTIHWVACNKLCQTFHIPSTCKWDMDLLPSIFILYRPLNWQAFTDLKLPKRLALYACSECSEYAQCDSPSNAVVTSARALATIANVLGTQDSRIFQGDGMKKALLNEDKKDMFSGTKVAFNDGGFNVFYPQNGKFFSFAGLDGEATVGWGGYNGSMMIFHRRGDFAVAFQPTAFNEIIWDERIGPLTLALAQCARQLHGDDWGR